RPAAPQGAELLLARALPRRERDVPADEGVADGEDRPRPVAAADQPRRRLAGLVRAAHVTAVPGRGRQVRAATDEGGSETEGGMKRTERRESRGLLPRRTPNEHTTSVFQRTIARMSSSDSSRYSSPSTLTSVPP